jgi:hypothetical protein
MRWMSLTRLVVLTCGWRNDQYPGLTASPPEPGMEHGDGSVASTGGLTRVGHAIHSLRGDSVVAGDPVPPM